MGNEASTTGGPKVGYHVLKVVAHSPGAQAGLAPFFDFIVAANGQVLDREDSRLVDALRSNLEHEVDLSVYSTKTEQVRRVKLIPSLQWGGSGIVGVSTRFCSVAAANENVWHVLEVSPNSPAAEAGLESHLDYIVGTPELAFNDPEDFFTLIQNNVGMAVQLYVYNLRDDNIRLVSLRPRKDWGGVGCLGCGVGYGLLHRIARDRKATLARYGIAVEDTELGEQRHDSPVTSPTSVAVPSVEVPPQTQVPVPVATTAPASSVNTPLSTPPVPQHPPAPSVGEPFAHSPQASAAPALAGAAPATPYSHSQPSPSIVTTIGSAGTPAITAPSTPLSQPLYNPPSTPSAMSPPSSIASNPPLLSSSPLRTPLSGGSPYGSSSFPYGSGHSISSPFAGGLPASTPLSGGSPYGSGSFPYGSGHGISSSFVSGGLPAGTTAPAFPLGGLPLPALSQPPTPLAQSYSPARGQYLPPGGYGGLAQQRPPYLPGSFTPASLTSSGGAPPLHSHYHAQPQQPLHTPTSTPSPQQPQQQQPFPPSSGH